MRINYLNFLEQWKEEKKYLLPLIENVLSSGQYIGVNTKETEKLEKNLSIYFKRKIVTLNSGTDALTIALHALGVKRGDEVITVANSFIASASSIAHLGAVPIFIDVLPDQNINPEKIEEVITKKTKAIMVVHLTGRSCNMDEILKIVKKRNIFLVEDCAQAFGTKYKDKLCGTFGDIACFSTHPLKNLRAMGDGGFIVTNNKSLEFKIKTLRNHGLKNRDEALYFGYNSRMDNIQSAILNFRLKNIDSIIKKRRSNALYYFKNLNKNIIFFPEETKEQYNTYHTFVIQVKRNRDKLKEYLKKNKIDTYINYPIPIHKQKFFIKKYKKFDLPNTEKQSKNILCLPIHHSLTEGQLEYIVKIINRFF